MNLFRNHMQRFLRAPADDGAGGGEGEGGGEGGEGQGGGEAPKRPEGLPDKYWDGEANTMRTEAVVKSLNDGEAFRGKRVDELKDIMGPEIIQAGVDAGLKDAIEKHDGERLAKRPETRDGYEIKMPDSFELPEGVKFDFKEGHPLTEFFRDLAFEQGFDQDQFSNGLQKYVEGEISKLPDHDTEMKQLGERATDRVDRVNSWLGTVITPEEAQSLSQFTATANGIQVLEKLMEATGGGGSTGDELGGGDGGTGDKPGSQSYEDKTLEMRKDPRYWRDRDKDFRRQVETRVDASAKARK